MKLNPIFIAAAISIAQLITPISTLCALQQPVDTAGEVVIQQITTRAALDMGSGKTKITVSDVNLETNQITKIWHQSAAKIELQKDLASSADGRLSQKIERELIKVLKAMQAEVSQFSPQEWVGVGTSVFRTALNGREFLERVKAATGIDIRIITQIEEGQIGFASAVAASNLASENIMAWDMGSGSFQVSTLINGDLEMYGAEFSFVSALEALFANRNQIFNTNTSPNPVSPEEALKLIETIRSNLPPLPAWMLQNNKQIIALGGGAGSFFSIPALATGHSTFTKEELRRAIFAHCGKNDEQLSHLLPTERAMVTLIFIYSVMDHCGFEQVSCFPTNGNCEGLLVTPSYWNITI